MNEKITRVCTMCGHEYTDVPALSRVDNTTLICPECGSRQAMESIGISKEEQEHIIEAMKKARNRDGE